MRRADEIYEVNMKRLGLLLLPTFWRKPLIGGLVYAGVSVLGRQLGELREYRKETGYRLEHNGQVCRLRGLLNDVFDVEERGIRVEDVGEGDEWDGVMVWMREVGRGVRLGWRDAGGGRRIGVRGLGGAGGVDFVVRVPERLRGVVDEVRLGGLVDCYRLAGKRWGLVWG